MLINAYELAGLLGVSHVTIYDYVSKGMPYTEEIKGLRTIKKFRYDDCLKWMEENRL